MVNFKGSKSEEERLTESTKIIEKYPDKIPVIVEKYVKSSIKNIDKNKYLVSGDMTMSQFIYIIRNNTNNYYIMLTYIFFFFSHHGGIQ